GRKRWCGSTRKGGGAWSTNCSQRGAGTRREKPGDTRWQERAPRRPAGRSARVQDRPEALVVLLDASALLALLYDEPGAAEVRAQIADASLLALNLEVVLGVLLRDGMPVDIARRTVDTLGLSMVPYTEAMAWKSA